MKRKIIIITLILLTVLGGVFFTLFYFFEYSKISYEFYFNDVLISSCNSAEVSDLFPKPNGGYRFTCELNKRAVGSLFLMYSTTNNDFEIGKIKDISLSDDEKNIRNQYLPFNNNENSNRFECKLSKELIKSSDLKLAKTLIKDIKRGEYRFATINPCGVIKIKIGEPK